MAKFNYHFRNVQAHFRECQFSFILRLLLMQFDVYHI